jgi:hypothetical protein
MPPPAFRPTNLGLPPINPSSAPTAKSPAIPVSPSSVPTAKTPALPVSPPVPPTARNPGIVLEPPIPPTTRQPAMPSAPAAAPRPSGRPVNPFLSKDPSQKARRLARALISDLAVYYPDRRKEGVANGTLKELFQEEIQKSWEEYTDQVGKEIAESTSYFTDALNEILAGGQRVF